MLEPDIDNLTALLPWLANHPDEVVAKGLAASEYVKKQWTWRHAAEIAAERLKALSSSHSN